MGYFSALFKSFAGAYGKAEEGGGLLGKIKPFLDKIKFWFLLTIFFFNTF